MKRLLAVAVLIGAMALTGCAPSKEQIACEQQGGTYEAYVITYTTTYIFNGKTTIPVVTPIYGYRCVT